MARYGIRAKTGLIEGLELKGVTGSFSGSLTVKELIGGGVIEQASFTLEKTGERKSIRYIKGYNDSDVERYGTKHVDVYGLTIVINPVPVDRYIVYDNNSFILRANQSREINITKWQNFDENGNALYFSTEILVMSYMISTQFSIHKK
ncbi:hypothetical protein MZB18_07365 [Haemophilus influenzae]|uniref:hypothetical protein n=1 Tax=Haemophilus influenzae TaxID=727 RepID=UPI000D01FE63|nr:hypothetical protein [Haemophilus influenzae]MCK9139956.1 hypothetical protein [Haemophilus influenzae]PRM16243.1 hypothetical protein BV002_00487 [Haemophilus influenzae]